MTLSTTLPDRLKQVTVYIRASQIEKLKKLSKKHGAPFAFYVRKAIDELLEKK